MSYSLRYHNPVICEYLASQYVTGLMTRRTRARMEQLLSSTTPEFSELTTAVAFWSDKLSSIDYSSPEIASSEKTWQAIEQSISLAPQATVPKSSWWHSLLFWQASSVVGLAASLILAFMLLLAPPAPIDLLGPNYMAAMSVHQNDATNNDIRFVINAYQKTDLEPSRLLLQWSQRQAREQQQRLHIWAEDIDTGQISYIGAEPVSNAPWHLTKSAWQAISNSSRLLVTATENRPTDSTILFSGPCVQLADWQQQAI